MFGDSYDYELIPIFCFDPRTFDDKVDKYNSRKCGIHRTKFMIESVADYRESLEKLGS